MEELGLSKLVPRPSVRQRCGRDVAIVKDRESMKMVCLNLIIPYFRVLKVVLTRLEVSHLEHSPNSFSKR